MQTMLDLYSPHGIKLGDEWYLSVYTPKGSLLLMLTNRRTVHCMTCGRVVNPNEGIRFEDRPYKTGFLCRPDFRTFIHDNGADGYRANIRGGLEVGPEGTSFAWFTDDQVSVALWTLKDGKEVLVP